MQQSDRQHSTTSTDNLRCVPVANSSDRHDSSMPEAVEVKTHTNPKVGQIVKYLPGESEELH